MYDITDSEEAMLPMPADWVKAADATGATVYQNSKTNITSNEHPYIQQGGEMADKLPLPEGWVLKEASVQGAPSELFFYHAASGSTGWDHPQLRHCVSRVLLQHGYGIIGDRILEKSPEGVPMPDWGLVSSPEKAQSSEISEQYNKYKESISDPVGTVDDIKNLNWVDMMQQLENTLEDSNMRSPAADSRYDYEAASDVSSSRSNSFEDYPQYSDEDDSLAYSHSDVYGAELNFNLSPTALTVSKRSQKWDEIKANMKYTKDGARQATREPPSSTMPQVNSAGIEILKMRIKETNADIQNLLLQIRTILCHSQDIDCATLNTLDPRLFRGSSHNTLRMKELTERAGNIIEYMRHQPKLLIPALGILWNTSGPVMVATMGFIVFNRMLHPFSSDGSMATAFLLEAVNYQVEDTADVVHVFHKVDPRVLMSRAIFISDSTVALKWDPLIEPMPMLTQHNTLLSCLLKAYSVRRDVSSYFRATWKPVLPALVSILEPISVMSITESQIKAREAEQDRIVSVSNIMSVAFKLIEVLMLDDSMVLFPVSATAMCRTFHELCGLDGVHSYVLYFLILPNLVKLLLGHHDSADSEDVIRYNPTGVHIDAYFDKSVWFNAFSHLLNEAQVVSRDGKTVHDPISLLIWSTWRLYAWSLLMDGAALATLTAADFFEPLKIEKKCLPMSDVKLRNLISRTRTKLDNGISLLLKLPVDSHACAFLDLDPSSVITGLEKRSKDITQLLSRRLSSLLVKPVSMTSHLVISDYELHMLFQSVACLLDASGHDGFEELMESISRYEHISERLGLEREETIMLLKICDDRFDQLPSEVVVEESIGTKFLADNNVLARGEGSAFKKPHDIEVEYHRLARGLKLSQKYIESLSSMHRRLENDVECSLTELVEDDTWFYAPEFEFDYQIDTAACRKKKTQAWASKIKPSLHGLTGMLEQQQAALKEKDPHMTLDEQAAQFFLSYRSTSEPPVDDARSVHSLHNRDKSKVSRNSGKPRYTKITLDPNAKFSAPTMSAISKSAPPDPTRADLHKQYIQSLRFETTNSSKSHSKLIKRDVSKRRDKDSHSVIASVKDDISSAAPFPEHLRHRVRGHNTNREFDVDEEDSLCSSKHDAVSSVSRKNYPRSRHEKELRPAVAISGAVPGSVFDSEQPRHPKPAIEQPDKGLFSPEQRSIPNKLANRFKNRGKPARPVTPERETPVYESNVNRMYMEPPGEEVLYASDAMRDLNAGEATTPMKDNEAKNSRCTPESEVLYSPESGGCSPPTCDTPFSMCPVSSPGEDGSWGDQAEVAEETVVDRDDPSPVPSPKRNIPLIPTARAHSRVDLVRAIESGFLATKQCRSGWPKVREVYFDREGNNICWREPRGRGPGMFSTFMRNSSFRQKDSSGVSYMLLPSITEIKRGVQTDIMKKVGLVDPECCVSLCNVERSLDLTFDSPEDRNYFIRSLQALVYPSEIHIT